MQTVSIRKTSITNLKTEIIVNAANSRLLQGSGVCGYIFKAAGAEKLQEACYKIGSCPTGSAVITPGFDLCPYIVHAVGPVWNGGNNHEQQQLYNCYQKAMELAKENQCRSIGFPLISAGVYGHPKDKAWKTAAQAIYHWFKLNQEYDIAVEFAVLEEEIYRLGFEAVYDTMSEHYKVSSTDWDLARMPRQYETFTLERAFSRQQMEKLYLGYLPGTPEDRWVSYMEGNALFIHRSRTGHCIYIIQFRTNNEHIVNVNRNPEQYKCTDIEEDRERLNKLLDMLSR
ncbi:MAG: macro domain-containing protein [Solobacterium sp.]|nr:macro domain-containing protein [Solobacterium sp.]